MTGSRNRPLRAAVAILAGSLPLQAERALNQALALDPENAEARGQLALLAARRARRAGEQGP